MPRRQRAARAASIALLALLAPPAPAQIVQYDITDTRGQDLPAKLTFLTLDGKVPEKLDIKSRVPEFASRKNVVYQLWGKGEIPVRAGRYRVYVSRGMEWSLAVVEIEVRRERPAVVKAALERVVDTRGYVSGDMHLHTKTFSGHGDANVEERVITFCAENLEWAVATDHNVLTDYRPYARRLGADRWIKTSVGNEVTTTELGHFNTFPLDLRDPPVNHRITDARRLFQVIREGSLDPIIQINHPRWTGTHGAYFRELDLSHMTGDAADRRFSYNFDSMEVLNEDTISGWELKLLPTGDLPALDHSVREDWFNLLNRGFSFTGVGNSDSHHVDEAIAGCPRNYVRCSTDDPPRASEAELVRAVRERRVSVSSGIFVTMTADGSEVGSRLRRRGEEVALEIAVQAAPWVDADRLVVVGNGEVVFSSELAGSEPSVQKSTAGRPVVRFKGTVKVRPEVDTWYLAYAAGDEPPYPMLHKVTVPLGFTNPVWVDADGDGRFTPLRDIATAAMSYRNGQIRLRPGEVTARLAGAGPVFRRQAVAVLSTGATLREVDPLAEFLRDPDFAVREAAAAALSRIGDGRAMLALQAARDSAPGPWERFVYNRELLKAGDLSALVDMREDYRKAEGLERFKRRRDLQELCRKTPPVRYWVVGPFPARTVEDGLAAQHAPEREIDLRRRYAAFERKPAGWKRVRADTGHYLNLREAFSPSEYTAGYAYVLVEARRQVRTCLLLGSKCGLDIRLNGRSIHRQTSGQSSSAASVLVPVELHAGLNTLLIKAVVERGDWGFNLMAVDPLGELRFHADDPAAPHQTF